MQHTKSTEPTTKSTAACYAAPLVVDTNINTQNPPEVSLPVFVDKLTVAKMFKITPRTLDVWLGKGLLPYYKIGRTVRFKPSDIETHLDATRIGGVR